MMMVMLMMMMIIVGNSYNRIKNIFCLLWAEYSSGLAPEVLMMTMTMMALELLAFIPYPPLERLTTGGLFVWTFVSMETAGCGRRVSRGWKPPIHQLAPPSSSLLSTLSIPLHPGSVIAQSPGLLRACCGLLQISCSSLCICIVIVCMSLYSLVF